MLANFESSNRVDSDGNPSGGIVNGTGIFISWQRGPLGRGAARVEPNGAFVETVIAAAKQRLEFYQESSDGKFACQENAAAIFLLKLALEALNYRTQRREFAGTEGTHEGT